MADAPTDFEQELEVFRTEAEAAAQFFYAYLIIRAVAGDHEPAAFITVDRKTILNKAEALAAQGVNVASPSQYLASTLGST